MEWINLRTATLRDPAYLCSEPVAQATWFKVLAYCCHVENGGLIDGAKAWADRQWQQTCGVTRAEVRSAKKLLTFHGEALLVWAYPREKEQCLRAQRKGGKAGAEKRWNGSSEPTPEAPLNAPLNGLPINSPIGKLNAERKGKEGKGIERASAQEGVEKAGRGAPDPELASLIDTSQFVLGIFGEKRTRLSNLAEHALGRQASALPLTPEQKERLRWWMALPEDPQDPWLKGRPRDASKLAEQLFDQLDRAKAHAAKNGGQISREKEPATKPEPEGWREWCADFQPGILPSAQSFWHLPESIRSAFELWRTA